MNRPDRMAAGELVSRAAPAGRGAGWVIDGFRAFRADWPSWLLISLTLTVASLVVQILVPLLGTLLVFLFTPVVVGSLMSALDGRAPRGGVLASDMFRAFAEQHSGALITIGLASFTLNLLAMVVAVVITVLFADLEFLTRLAQDEQMLRAGQELTFFLGLAVGALVYLALLIPITMLVWFAPALVVLEGEPAVAAMRHSFIGCLRNFVPYLVYGLVGLVVFPLLILFTAGIGMVVLVPVGLASIHAAYRDIFHRR